MSITFKQFVHLVEMSDEEFAQVQEGMSLSDILGWLKGPNTAAKKQKIDQVRKSLGHKRDAKSIERAAEIDAALQAFASGKKPAKPGEIKDVDLDQALNADDRKFNAKMDRMRSMKEAKEAAYVVIKVGFTSTKNDKDRDDFCFAYAKTTGSSAQELMDHAKDADFEDGVLNMDHVVQNVTGGDYVPGSAYFMSAATADKAPDGRKYFAFNAGDLLAA